ncbi:MAG: lipid II flippase MurJ [Patescibacteria group bacterium]
MVNYFLKLFNREFGGFHHAAFLLALSSIGSSALGILRDRMLAGTFGAGKLLDIYYAAFRIPDFLYILSLSLVSVTVLIPFFLERLSKSKERAYSFFNQVFTVFIFMMTGLAVIFFMLAPFFVKIIAPGFSLEEQGQLTILTRILLLSPILLGFSNLISSVIQSFRRFFIYALSPLFYNLSIIFGINFLYPLMGMKGIILGVVLGAFLHAGIQLPGLSKLGFLPRFDFKIDFNEIKKVFLFSVPRTFGLGMNQILLIFITAIASLLASGSIAVFNLAMNMQSVLLSVIGVSYSVAAFPTLAKLYENNQRDQFLSQTFSAARQIIFWSIPASILFVVLRAQIVRVILGTGAFNWTDTRLVAASLALFSISITAQSLIILFVRSFYAAGRTLRPLKINIFSSAFTIFFSFLCVSAIENLRPFEIFFGKILRVEDIGNIGVLMLPFIFSLGMILNIILLVFSFKKELGWLNDVLKKTLFEIIFSSLLIGIITYLSLQIFDNIFDLHTVFGVFMQGFLSGLFGIISGFTLLIVLENNELKEIIGSFRQKFWKVSAIASEPEEL